MENPDDPDNERRDEAEGSPQPAEGGRQEVAETLARHYGFPDEHGEEVNADRGWERPGERGPSAHGGGQTGVVTAAAQEEGRRDPREPFVVPAGLVDAIQQIENSTTLDPLVATFERVAATVARPGAAHALLTGSWLGHAAHPLLTDLPLGAWLSTSLLDMVGGRRCRTAATGLLTFGVVTALPTAATGLAELLHTNQRSRRVGAVHAVLNAGALVLYTASLVARRRHHGPAVLLGLAGGATASIAGYLGGHLTVARKVGTRDRRFDTHAP